MLMGEIYRAEMLLQFSPTQEDLEALKNYKGDSSQLAEPEQYLLEVMLETIDFFFMGNSFFFFSIEKRRD